MDITLRKLIKAVESLGVSTEHLELAIDALNRVLAELDEVEVKGRQQVDTLLGCMMAIDAIIGKDGENNSGQANF